MLKFECILIGAEHILLKCPNGKEGPGDVIIGNSCLRLVIFVVVVFLVSCCTIVVLVSGSPFLAIQIGFSYYIRSFIWHFFQ